MDPVTAMIITDTGNKEPSTPEEKIEAVHECLRLCTLRLSQHKLVVGEEAQIAEALERMGHAYRMLDLMRRVKNPTIFELAEADRRSRSALEATEPLAGP